MKEKSKKTLVYVGYTTSGWERAFHRNKPVILLHQPSHNSHIQNINVIREQAMTLTALSNEIFRAKVKVELVVISEIAKEYPRNFTFAGRKEANKSRSGYI